MWKCYVAIAAESGERREVSGGESESDKRREAVEEHHV